MTAILAARSRRVATTEMTALTENRLLAAVPAQARSDLAAVAVLRDFDLGHVLFEQRAPIDEVAFPLTGVVSLLSVMDDGRAVEVATVGREGVVGLPVFLQSALTSSHKALVQVRGCLAILPAAAFLQFSDSGGPLQYALQRYSQALITQIAQNAACGRVHSIEQRCARWLLMTHDRVPGDDLLLTQEFLGQMLGVARQGANEVARALQDDGMIANSRGRVRVLDRSALQARACECYAVIRDDYERLLPAAED